MNNARRKAIAALAEEASQLIGVLEDLHARAEELRDEEQEYYDNMPESFQNGDKGIAAQEAIEHLDSIVNSLSEAETGVTDAVSGAESVE